MSYPRTILFSYAAGLALTVGVQASPLNDSNPSDAMPAAPVPIVPLPPALVGAGVSIGIATALRFTRHRRWITLR